MNKPLDSCLKLIKEAIESARTITIPNMPKNQLKPTRKTKMILKSDKPSY
jgi:hypothetical protein